LRCFLPGVFGGFLECSVYPAGLLREDVFGGCVSRAPSFFPSRRTVSEIGIGLMSVFGCLVVVLMSFICCGGFWTLKVLPLPLLVVLASHFCLEVISYLLCLLLFVF